MACALILSLCFIGGCSKDDDEAGSGSSKVKGNVEIDGKKFDVKYGYKISDESGATYSFYDKDLMKYAGQENPNVEFSAIIFFSYENEPDIIEMVGIAYKTNPYNDKGYGYETEYDEVDFYDYGSFSESKGKVKCSAKKLPMEGFEYGSENYTGRFYANFSIEGSVKDFSGMYEEYSSRGIEIQEVTDPKEVAFLKRLMPKRPVAQK